MRNKTASWALGLVILQIILSLISNQMRSDARLVLAIASVVLLAYSLILGIRALTQIKKTAEKGRGIAISAIVIDCLILIFIAWGFVASLT